MSTGNHSAYQMQQPVNPPLINVRLAVTYEDTYHLAKVIGGTGNRHILKWSDGKISHVFLMPAKERGVQAGHVST
jgi:hypothetical protein